MKWLGKRFFMMTAAAGLLVGAGCAGDPVMEQQQDAAGRTYTRVEGDPIHARTYTLSNGLTVMLARNDRAPRIRSLIAVRAGSADDPLRSTGLAHYFEHMMFKGNAVLGSLDWDKEQPLLAELARLFEQYRNETVPEKRAAIYREIDRVSAAAAPYGNDEYWQLCRAIGAQETNAWTSFDETVYVNDIPASVLEKFLQLESCRFSGIALRRFHTELETVYEEFNLLQDRDESMAFWEVMKQLFPHHAYGRMVIGLPEHLKAPSMNDIHDFFRRYYRPSQMAVILVGDLDFDRTMEMLERTFGKLPEPPPEPPENNGRVTEKPLTEPVVTELTGRESESVMIAWRFENTRENRVMLTMIQELLQNGRCGLVDTELLQPGRVQHVSVGVFGLRDYLGLAVEIKPKEGQTLEAARQLLMDEIREWQDGNVPDWMPRAAANNIRLRQEMAGDKRSEAAGILKSRFIHGRSAVDELTEINDLEKITADGVAAFLSEHLRNSVTVYKRRGEPAHKIHAEKPPITPVTVPDRLSAFAGQWLALPSDPPSEPVFVDYQKVLPRREIAPGVGFYAAKNEQNEYFRLTYAVSTGGLGDQKLSSALSLLNLIGADGMDTAALRREFYRLAASIQIARDPHYTRVSVAGLSRYAEETIRLFFRALELAEVTPEAVAVYRDKELKARANRWQDPDRYFQYGIHYAMYGGRQNYLCDEISGEELRQLEPGELQQRIRGYLSLPGDFVYYGPAGAEEVMRLLPVRPATASLPPAREYRTVAPARDTVYLIDSQLAGVKVALLRQDPDIPDMPQAFSAVYNHCVSHRFFTELRERQAMAYAVGSYFTLPTYSRDNAAVFQAVLATSPDKLIGAMEQINGWQAVPPVDQEAFESSRKYLLDVVRSNRVQPGSWYDRMKHLERMKMTDPMEAIWQELPAMTYENFMAECRRRAGDKPAAWVIVGDLKRLDKKALSRFGEIRVLAGGDIFPAADKKPDGRTDDGNQKR